MNDISFRTDKPELAVINYIGYYQQPKVMIPYRSLWSNTKFANDCLEFIHAGDNIVCMPMAHHDWLRDPQLHLHELSHPFLGKTPSPRVHDAFARVKLWCWLPLNEDQQSVLPKLQRCRKGDVAGATAQPACLAKVENR